MEIKTNVLEETHIVLVIVVIAVGKDVFGLATSAQLAYAHPLERTTADVALHNVCGRQRVAAIAKAPASHAPIAGVQIVVSRQV
jgi:hypothetical protein